MAVAASHATPLGPDAISSHRGGGAPGVSGGVSGAAYRRWPATAGRPRAGLSLEMHLFTYRCFRKKKAPIMATQRINIRTIPPNINAAPREIAVTGWPMVPYPLLCRRTHASPIVAGTAEVTPSRVLARS